MLKGFKTEINPTQEQREKINRTIGTCRYVYNLFLGYNKERHLRGQEYLNAYAFSKWLNNEYVPENPDKSWIKEVSAKAVKRAIMNADTACKRFFKKKGGYPRFKRKDKSDVKMYFVRNNDTDCLCERHRIKIPTLGWVRLKEKGYLPVTKTGLVIKSGTISERAGRYWVSVLADVPVKIIRPRARNDDGLGIDLGIKDLAILSNGKVFKNINRTGRERQLEKSLKRKQRSLSRKHENKKKGGAAQGKNIQKQILRIQRLHRRIEDIRNDYIRKTVNEIVRTKPSYITIEDLNVKGMMKNRHLARAVASQKLSYFDERLRQKSREEGIELRFVSRWYPSSKLCHECGSIKKDLKLSERVYKCPCGYIEDRDYNASLNLRDAKAYRIA